MNADAGESSATKTNIPNPYPSNPLAPPVTLKAEDHNQEAGARVPRTKTVTSPPSRASAEEPAATHASLRS